jgi:predicted permease
LIKLLLLFANNILPILLAAGIGYTASRLLKLNPRPISQVTFYIFSPCLLFTLLTTNQLQGKDVALTITFTISVMLLIGIIAWTLSSLFRFERKLRAAIILVAVFGNMGNFGLALVAFAFGEQALAYASICFLTESILVHTVGVLIVSMGKSGLRKSLIGLFKIPSAYAVILAAFINTFGWTLPLPIDRTISILSNASIPVMMVILGIQLQHSDGFHNKPALAIGSGLRLACSAILAVGLGRFLGLSGAALQANVTQSAMPTAVITTILATEYDIDASYVTGVVIITTLLSPLILTPLLYFLGA